MNASDRHCSSRWYWVISCDNAIAEPFVGTEGNLGRDDWEFSEGTPIESWSGGAWVRANTAESDGEPDDVLQTLFALPIFSRRLRLALERCRIGGIQYLPIDVIGFDRRRIDGFAIANILNCVDALDRQRSRFEVYPEDYFLPQRRGKMRDVSCPVLSHSVLAGIDVVRLSCYKAPIYVSERFVDAFTQTECTGYSFREVETS